MSHEEVFDILSPEGIPTGETRPRSEVHRLGLWHRTVHIWVVTQFNQDPLSPNPVWFIALQRRALTKESNPGLWDISAAGHISAGQSILDAAQRELFEELGILIDPSRFKLLQRTHDQGTFNQGHFLDNEYHEIFVVHLNEAEAQSIKHDPVEVAEVRWISATDFALELHKEELRDAPQQFVPHSKEYQLILRYLQGRETV